MFYYQDISLLEAISHVNETTEGNKDFRTTIGAFVGGMIAPDKVQTEEGVITLSKEGFGQLVTDRLGYSAASLNHSGLSLTTKLAMLRDLAQAKAQDEIKVRISEADKGLKADAVLSEAYTFFDNRTLVTMLSQLLFHGGLPQDTKVMSMALSPNGRYLDLRLRAPGSWDIIIDEKGRPCPFLGNLLITNDEKGKGKLEVRAAITRGPCLNTTIGQAIISQIHRFSNPQDFYRTLGEGVTHINQYALEMGDRMAHMMNVTTDQPLLIFQKVGERLGVPQYAMTKAQEYWESEGQDHDLYHIVQAVARGVQEMTVTKPKFNPKWEDRVGIEQAIWVEAEMITRMYDEGLGMGHYLICDSCHQPLPEPENEHLS